MGRLRELQRTTRLVLVVAAIAVVALCVVLAAGLHARRNSVVSSAASAVEAGVHHQKTLLGGLGTVSEDSNIPCIIHRTRKSLAGIAESIESQVSSWTRLNPKCVHVVWTDESMLSFVESAAPEVLSEYNWLHSGVEKSDFFRYIVLSKLGGVYTDLDTVCLRPIESWTFGVSGIEAIVGMEWDRPYSPGNDYQVCQWTIASAPNNSVLRRAVEIVADNIRREASGERMWYSDAPPDNQIIKRTGPLAFTAAVQEFLDRNRVTFPQVCNAQGPVVVGDTLMILPVWGFSPGVDHSRSKPPSDPQACVQHLFEGSWKPK